MSVHAIQMGTRGWRARGLISTWSLDGGPVREQETQGCRHCQAILVIGAKSEQAVKELGGHPVGGFCPHCQSVLCEGCEKKRLTAASAREGCSVYAEQIEKQLRLLDHRRANGLGL